MERLLRRYFFVVYLVAIALGAFFLAQATARVVEMTFFGDSSQAAPPRRRPATTIAASRRVSSDDATVILRRNILCSTCEPVVDEPQSSEPADTGPVKSTLPLQLVATLTSPDPRWSFAALRDTQTQKTGLFGVAAVLPSGPEVTTIEERRVYLRNSGRLEYIDLEGAAASPAPVVSSAPAIMPAGDTGPFAGAELDSGIRRLTDSSYEVDRGLVEKALTDPAFIGRQARIVPSVKDGVPNGFKLYAVRPGSVYARIGLSNGDTIHAINGIEIKSPEDALNAYTKLRSASHINVSLSRRGQPMSLDYSIR